MVRCTRCNTPMSDHNPFDEPDPQWLCEECGGLDGYTPAPLTRDQVTAYLCATGWRLTHHERFTSASHERWAHPMGEYLLCLSWPRHGDFNQHTSTDQEVARAIRFIADLEGRGCDEAETKVIDHGKEGSHE